MNGIKRNTDPLKGPPDGIETIIQAVVTLFSRVKKKGYKGVVQRKIKSQTTAPCNILCSYSNGTVGLSVRSMDFMLTIRVDELIEIMREAALASQDFQSTLPEQKESEVSDAMLEELWRELGDIPFDEADSPHGLILSRQWRHFPKGVDRGDIWAWFDVMHSKGVAYLIGQE